MIPGLLHGRRLAAAIIGLIASPAYRAVAASQSSNISAQAMAVFTINPDGTFIVSGTGADSGSGLWYDPITVGAGSAYEVRISLSGSGGQVSNAASSWVALSAARSLSLTSQRFDYGTTSASYTATVEIRATGGSTVLSSGSFQISASATVSPPNYLSGLNGKLLSAHHQAATTQPQTRASVSLQMMPDGTWSVSGSTPSGSVVQPAPVTGVWHIYGGSAESYDVLIEPSATGAGDRILSSSATSWQSLAQAQSMSLTLPAIAANNTVSREASGTARIRIRRRSNGEVVSDNTISMAVSTNGYL